jgi:hypothetical protein
MGGIGDIQRRRGGLLIVGVCGFTLALAAGVYVVSGHLPMNFLWGSGFILAGGVWIGLQLAGRIPVQAWFVGLLGICLLDWTFVDRSLFTPRQASQVFSEARQLAGYLASQEGMFRIYSPSYSLPQQTSANYGLQLADGVDPLQMQSYVSYMQAASGVPDLGYQVTLPPFANGDPASANESYLPDPQLLGLLNVRFIAAEFDLIEDDLVLSHRFGRTRLYENMKALPRAWLQEADAPPSQDAREVKIALWTPERVELHAQGPGLLILSELAYPGWSVSVDGRLAELETAAGILRSVRLKEGEHEVIFFYRPFSLYLGLSLCIGTILFLVVGTHIGKRKTDSASNIHLKSEISTENLADWGGAKRS